MFFNALNERKILGKIAKGKCCSCSFCSSYLKRVVQSIKSMTIVGEQVYPSNGYCNCIHSFRFISWLRCGKSSTGQEVLFKKSRIFGYIVEDNAVQLVKISTKLQQLINEAKLQHLGILRECFIIFFIMHFVIFLVTYWVIFLITYISYKIIYYILQ